MGCKYRIMDKCKSEENKNSFCLGKDGCPYYEDENAIKVTDKYMTNPDICSCCGEIWNRQNLKNIPLGRHELHLCPDCYAEYIKPLNEIREEIKQYNRKPSHYPVDMIKIATVLQIIDKYKTKPKDIEAQATEFLAEARSCAENEVDQ